MGTRRLTPLAGARCLSKRHRLRADRSIHTADDGSMETHFWCTVESCPRYGQAVAVRAM